MENNSKSQSVINSTRNWVETIVVELNLCPFAKKELIKDRIRFVVSEANTNEGLLKDLDDEFELLQQNGSIETTILIHPNVLSDFYDYNEFLYDVNEVIVTRELEGVFQIASFHPNYQFGGTQPNDAENYTNRSPYPILHILREDSLETALGNYPDADLIPERNVKLLSELGITKMQAMLQACITDGNT